LRDLDVPSQKRWLRKILLVYAGIGSMYAIFMLAFGGTLLRIVFGPELAAGGRLLSVMALLPLVQGFVHSANVGVMALGRPEYSFVSRALATAGTTTVGVLLMLTLGLLGAAFGLVVSVGLLAAGLWISLFRYWGAPARAAAP
jgi:O-antigen/teichoic acid export membrane protein